MAHILIIDDDPATLRLFRQFLENAGYSIDVAANGHEGLSAMKKRFPDLVITDVMMPEMDGLEILQEIRENRPETPVIAISGGIRGAPLNFLLDAATPGTGCMLQKPVVLTDLLRTVRELLGEITENK